jgi:hypothetical protein
MDDPSGVPLAHYLDAHPGAGVQLNCEVCGHQETLPMAGVVVRLEARGINARAFGIRRVAKLVDKACACGARSWTSRPAWPPWRGPDAQKPRPAEAERGE